MAILKKILILTLPLFLTGCYEDFDPKIDTKPVLCLNSLITAGSPISVKVSHTWVFTDQEGEKDHSVSDATLKIYANDVQVDSDYIPQEGDRIRIEAFSPKYGTADAEVTVPYAEKATVSDSSFKLESIWAEHREQWGVDANLEFDMFISIDIPAAKDAGRYFRLDYNMFGPEGLYEDPNGYYELIGNEDEDDPYDYEDDAHGEDPFRWNFSSGHFEFLDPVFYEHVTAFDDVMNGSYGSSFFSDRLFTEDPKTLKFGFSSCFFNIGGWDMDTADLDCGWEVTLYSISESYYKWLAYELQSDGVVFGDFSDFGLADPIWGYSNVSTGAGVVAAQSAAKYTINIREDLYKSISEALNK